MLTLTHSYTLNVVYSHNDNLKILYSNSHLPSDTLHSGTTHTFIPPTLTYTLIHIPLRKSGPQTPENLHKTGPQTPFVR